MSSISHINIPSVLMIFWSTKERMLWGGVWPHALHSSHFLHTAQRRHYSITRPSQMHWIPNIQLVTCKSQQWLITNARFQCQINASGVATKYPVKEQKVEKYRRYTATQYQNIVTTTVRKLTQLHNVGRGKTQQILGVIYTLHW